MHSLQFTHYFMLWTTIGYARQVGFNVCDAFFTVYSLLYVMDNNWLCPAGWFQCLRCILYSLLTTLCYGQQLVMPGRLVSMFAMHSLQFTHYFMLWTTIGYARQVG